MVDLKTLSVLNESLDITLASLIEENAMSKTSPYVQKFVKAQKVVQSEMKKIQAQKLNAVKALKQRD